jgi:L-malate glycosyltransferase
VDAGLKRIEHMSKPVKLYRLARWLYLHRVPLLPSLIHILIVFLFHCDIPYQLDAGEGFELGYWGLGTVIHPQAKIGKNVFIAQGVTIGGRGEGRGLPEIGNDVYVASGAKVLGEIVVGDGSVIGANAVVIRSVPPRCSVGGVPARILRENIDIRQVTGWPRSEEAQDSRKQESEIENSSVLPRRIFLMVESFNMGGSEHQMVELARRINSSRYQVTVGCIRAEGPLLGALQAAAIPVVEFRSTGMLKPKGIYQLFRLALFLRKNRFHVVQTYDLYSTLIGVPASRLARTPVVISSRRDLASWWWYTPRNRRILRHIQNLSSFVVGNSVAVRDFLVKEDGFDPAKIRVILNGIDADSYVRGRENRGALFPSFNEEDKLIAVVANMNVPTKGHQDLVEAAKKVCALFPRVRFILIGDGCERSNIERKISDLGLQECFCFLGRRSDVPELLSCCDLSVLPSWAEGLPNAVIESLAAGLPVVATRVGGIPEIIEDGESGLLVPPHNPNCLAEAILRILNDPEFARLLGRAARDRVQRVFSFERLLRETANLYEEGLARKAG